MLPMGMPSKRGRGSAIAMHSSSTSEKIQKMMASSLNENSAVKLKTYPPDASLSKVEKSNNVCANYYQNIPEHDYCQNVPKPNKETNVTIDYSEEDILDLEDIEKWSDNENNDEQEHDSGINDSFNSNSNTKKTSKRNYRKRDRENSPEIDVETYFDKIPSYYTALSSDHNRKKVKLSTSGKKVISIQDYLQQNPIPYQDASTYSKLPAYYSCFTNSTKYDETESKVCDSSQDSRSSGYSSIPSAYRSRSPSPTYSKSPSRSRPRVRYSGNRGRRRGRRSERCSSYSSADSRSSSSRCSMCSR
jgi:hypothetical protein